MDRTWQLRDAESSRLIAYVRVVGRTAKVTLPGDAARGQAMGPELTSIGAQRSAAYLREAIVKPEAVVPERYLLVRAHTRDGRDIQRDRVHSCLLYYGET